MPGGHGPCDFYATRKSCRSCCRPGYRRRPTTPAASAAAKRVVDRSAAGAGAPVAAPFASPAATGILLVDSDWARDASAGASAGKLAARSSRTDRRLLAEHGPARGNFRGAELDRDSRDAARRLAGHASRIYRGRGYCDRRIGGTSRRGVYNRCSARRNDGLTAGGCFRACARCRADGAPRCNRFRAGRFVAACCNCRRLAASRRQ